MSKAPSAKLLFEILKFKSSFFRQSRHSTMVTWGAATAAPTGPPEDSSSAVEVPGSESHQPMPTAMPTAPAVSAAAAAAAASPAPPLPRPVVASATAATATTPLLFNPTSAPSNLDRRIAALEHRLLEEGIGASLPPQPRSLPSESGVSRSDDTNSNTNNNNGNEQILQTFLSTLRSMSSNVSRTPTAPDARIHTTKHRALSSLLSIVELSLDETTRLSTHITALERSGSQSTAQWETKEQDYRQVISELVARVESLDGQVTQKDEVLTEAQKKVTELTDELDGCKHRLREVTAELNTSLEQQQQQQKQRKEAETSGKDVATSTGTDGEEDDDGARSANDGEAAADEEDGTLAQIRRENERLRQMIDEGGRMDGGYSCSVGSAAASASASASGATGHDAIHIELRAQAALLEEENRRLLQRLDIGACTAGGSASVSTSTVRPDAAAGTPLATSALFSPPPTSQFALGTSSSMSTPADVLQLQAQNEELQRALRDRDGRLSRAEANLRSLLEQSRTNAAEASRLATEGGTTRRRLDEETRRAEAAERTVRDAERERSDILRAYRAVVEERAQLAAKVVELLSERSRLSQQLTLRHDELQAMRKRVGEMERELNRHAQQKMEYDRRLAEATRETQSLRNSLAAIEAQNAGLRRDVETSKQSTGVASNQALELHRAMTKAQQEAEELRRSISTLESGKTKLESALAEERMRCEGMENIVSATRTKEAAASEQIQKLSRENARLAMKLNEADARLEVASARSSRRGRLSARGEALVLGEATVNRPTQEKANADANGGIPATISFSKE